MCDKPSEWGSLTSLQINVKIVQLQYSNILPYLLFFFFAVQFRSNRSHGVILWAERTPLFFLKELTSLFAHTYSNSFWWLRDDLFRCNLLTFDLLKRFQNFQPTLFLFLPKTISRFRCPKLLLVVFPFVPLSSKVEGLFPFILYVLFRFEGVELVPQNFRWIQKLNKSNLRYDWSISWIYCWKDFEKQ